MSIERARVVYRARVGDMEAEFDSMFALDHEIWKLLKGGSALCKEPVKAEDIVITPRDDTAMWRKLDNGGLE